MPLEEAQDYIGSVLADFNTKIRDLEDRNRLMKERLLLIGQNLVEIREKNNTDLLEMKRDLEILKMDINRMKSFLESAAGEFGNYAKKSELSILSKQAKMFQPMQFVKKQDLKKAIHEELKSINSNK
jgi:hypothetical protein